MPILPASAVSDGVGRWITYMARIVVAMSGGVDSSVAALLLKRQGHEVIGLFMRTGVHTEEHAAPSPHKKGCCSSLDAADARRVADMLDIPFYALDFAAEFDRIIENFVDEYTAGRTPNPCVMCNNWLKFGKLWSYGTQLDADFIATGHYSRIVAGPGGPELHRAISPEKDQSYVLHGVRKQMLGRLMFPVGDRPKDEIRALARQAGLPVFNKPDSQEICFVSDGDYTALVRRRRPGLQTAGKIVSPTGEVLAEHHGIEAFTVGQRKRLGYAAGERRYVLAILPADNTVVVGTREQGLSAGLTATDFNWLMDPPTEGRLACEVKIRYRSNPVPAEVQALPLGGAEIRFCEPQPAVAPGQAVVCYQGTRVLGGGRIEAPLPLLVNPSSQLA